MHSVKQFTKKIRIAIFATIYSLCDSNLVMYILMIYFAFAAYFEDTAFAGFLFLLTIWESKFMWNIIRSATTHWVQILGTLFLIVIVLFWYAIISFNAAWRGKYTFEEKMVNFNSQKEM